MLTPKIMSSQLLKTNCLGLVCNRALTILNVVLVRTSMKYIKKKYNTAKVSIIFFCFTVF